VSAKPLPWRVLNGLEREAEERPERLAGLGLLALVVRGILEGVAALLALLLALLAAALLVALPWVRLFLRKVKRRLANLYLNRL
jgi:hypothetical protein